jgi:hypothetical protein
LKGDNVDRLTFFLTLSLSFSPVCAATRRAYSLLVFRKGALPFPARSAHDRPGTPGVCAERMMAGERNGERAVLPTALAEEREHALSAASTFRVPRAPPAAHARLHPRNYTRPAGRACSRDAGHSLRAACQPRRGVQGSLRARPLHSKRQQRALASLCSTTSPHHLHR